MRSHARLCGITRYALAIAAAIVWTGGNARASDDVAPKLSSAPESVEWAVESATIPFDITLDLPMILARINGTGPYYFGVDTGVLGATLDDDIAARVGLRASGKKAGNSDPTLRSGVSKVVRVEELNIGGVLLKNLDVAVADYDLTSQGGRRYDGTLGLSVFAKCLLTLDYPELSFTLRQGKLPASDGYQVLDYKEVNGLATLPLKFGDVAVDAVLDTYSVDAFVLSDKLSDQVKLVEPATPEADAPENTKKAKPRASGQIRLGSHRLVDPPVRFEGNTSAMGQLVLYEFSMTIDQANQRVALERDESNFISFEMPSKFGFDLLRVGRKMAISRVVPGTPACRRGLKVGDVVLGVNRQHAKDFDNLALQEVLTKSDRVLLHISREGNHLLFKIDAD